MNWLYYLLEANLYLVLFYGFYRLFLQNETFYNLNRYFLLLSTIISFALPVLQLGFLKPTIDQIHSDYLYAAGEVPPMPIEPPSSAVDSSVLLDDINWFYIFYLVIAFGFALKLSFSIYKIIKLWFKAEKQSAGKITLIKVIDESTAFSFFNLLFIHPELANQPAVLKHEMVHIKQKHSFDVVFFEVVQIICWFNPILYFIKKDIKLLHEYIADELTTNVDIQKHEYALFLIQNSFGLRAQPITNQIFNQSILKRRINMLNKKRTAVWARLRLLLALPLTGIMLCVSTMAFTKDYGYVDLLPEKSESVAPIQVKPKVATVKKDQIKFPPTFKPKVQNRYFVNYRTDGKKAVRLDYRYAVVNGKPLENQDKFYGASNTESITILNVEEATKRYGTKGARGAVEITGSKIVFDNKIFRFPPPIVKPDITDRFRPRFETKESTGKVVNIESRYIVINGIPVENMATFYGVTNTKNIIYLNKQAAVKKYGQIAKFGAVEIIGNDIKYLTEAPVIPPPPVEPPPPRQDKIKFPPPVVKPDKHSFRPRLAAKVSTGKVVNDENRYIVINGVPLENKTTFYGVNNTKDVIYLNKQAAVKKYGEVAKFGAVEIIGDDIKYITEAPVVPPPPVEPPPPRYKPKKSTAATPPPPPVEPPAPKKKTEKTFAVVIPNQIGGSSPSSLPITPDKNAKKIRPEIVPNQIYNSPPPPVDPVKKTLNLKLKEG